MSLLFGSVVRLGLEAPCAKGLSVVVVECSDGGPACMVEASAMVAGGFEGLGVSPASASRSQSLQKLRLALSRSAMVSGIFFQKRGRRLEVGACSRVSPHASWRSMAEAVCVFPRRSACMGRALVRVGWPRFLSWAFVRRAAPVVGVMRRACAGSSRCCSTAWQRNGRLGSRVGRARSGSAARACGGSWGDRVERRALAVMAGGGP